MANFHELVGLFFSTSQLLRWPGHSNRIIFRVQCLGQDNWEKSLRYVSAVRSVRKHSAEVPK